MLIQVHGFNWEMYAERVMPAFGQWLLEGDIRAVQELYEQTRCAYEEQYLPETLQRLRVWPRALAFLQTLPHGPYSRREYQKLCSAQQYTALSDRYLYKHPPQLYQHSNALRSIWGAILESFCLPWGNPTLPTLPEMQHGLLLPAGSANYEGEALLEKSADAVTQGEVASLLSEAGLIDLAKEIEMLVIPSEQLTLTSGEPVREQKPRNKRVQRKTELPGTLLEPMEPMEHTAAAASNEQDAEPDEETVVAAQGIELGQSSNLLQLRGWLANHSVRAMALFEFLACSRRNMPFGFEAGEPFGAFCGYLTPDEVWQLASCLEGILPPDKEASEEDYLNYRYQHYGIPPAFRLIDEVLPGHAADFLYAVRKAAQQGLGLIASIE